MFKDSHTGYILASVVLVTILVGLTIGYETAYRDDDSFHDTAIAVLQWLSTVVSGTLIILAGWEISIMVLANRLKKQWEKAASEEGRKEGRQEGRQEANEAWIAKLKEAGIDPDTLQPIEKKE